MTRWHPPPPQGRTGALPRTPRRPPPPLVLFPRAVRGPRVSPERTRRGANPPRPPRRSMRPQRALAQGRNATPHPRHSRSQRRPTTGRGARPPIPRPPLGRLPRSARPHRLPLLPSPRRTNDVGPRSRRSCRPRTSTTRLPIPSSNASALASLNRRNARPNARRGSATRNTRRF